MMSRKVSRSWGRLKERRVDGGSAEEEVARRGGLASRWISRRSAPAASKRGARVREGLSWGAISTTKPLGQGVPSGRAEPRETQAARVRAKREAPQPGAAARRVRAP